MPRRNRRARDDEPERPRLSNLPVGGPPGWQVRQIHATNATKTYTCPGCHRDVLPGVGHVVAWETGRDDERRHWHTGCWKAEANRLRGGGRPMRY